MAVPSMLNHIAALALSIGVALFVSGVLLALARSAYSLTVLAAALAVAGVFNIRGFAAFDDVWSAKRLVQAIRPAVDDEVVWISEGSQEIGGSAGISFYLGVDRGGQARTVKIMEDDPRRRPPKFPMRPNYLIKQDELARIWNADTPALFVTDFQRDWAKDREGPRLPRGEVNLTGATCGGNRRIFANRAAWGRFPKLHPNTALEQCGEREKNAREGGKP
jgi:hypothetical protein